MTSLKLFLNNSDFSDINLIVENQVLYAHKVILASKSPTFKDILSNGIFKDSLVSPLLIEDVSFTVFYSILEYIYTESTNYCLETVWDLMKASRYFRLNDLTSECVDYVKKSITPQNVQEVWKMASTLNFGNIIDYILLHFKDFGKSKEKQVTIKEEKIQPKVEKQNPFAIEQKHQFNIWEDNSLPPTAFPTNETLNSFPEFFNIQQDEPIKLEKRDSISLTRKLSIKDNSLGIALQQMLNCITKLFNCERSTLFLYDKDNDELYSQVSKGQEQIRMKINEGIIGNTFKSGQTLKQLNEDSHKYVICSPILKDKTVIGVLEVLNKSNPFSTEDEGHLKTISLLFSYLFSDDQRRKSIIDVNTITDDFFLKDNNLDDQRNSLDFLLPNEDLDTSYNSLIRSCSISLDRPIEIVEEPVVEEPVVKEEEKKKRKRKNDNIQFMHFRIPRKELQFVQFEAPKRKKQ